MAVNFTLTTAGRSALLADQGTNEVQLRRLQLGSGGRGDLSAASRAALEAPRDAGPLVSSQGNISVGVLLAAEIEATAAYSVNEIGIWARIGVGGEFLFAYWAAADAVAAAVRGVRLLVPATLQITDAVPDVTVTVSPSLTLAGAGSFVALADTPAALVAGAYLRGVSPGAGAIENVAPLGVLKDVLAAASPGGSLPAPPAAKKYGVEIAPGGGVSLVEIPFDALLAARAERDQLRGFLGGLQSTTMRFSQIGVERYAAGLVLTTDRPRIRVVNRLATSWRAYRTSRTTLRSSIDFEPPTAVGTYTSNVLTPGVYLLYPVTAPVDTDIAAVP